MLTASKVKMSKSEKKNKGKQEYKQETLLVSTNDNSSIKKIMCNYLFLGPVRTYLYSLENATFFLRFQKNSRPIVAFRIVFARPHAYDESI